MTEKKSKRKNDSKASSTYEDWQRQTLRELFASVITILSFATVSLVLKLHIALANWTGIDTFRFVDPVILICLYAVWLLAVFILQRLKDLKSMLDVNDRITGQLSQARKLSALGGAVCGIAHDFNNVVTVLRGMIDITISDGALSDSLLERLNDMKKAADQSDRLVRQLMDVGRKKPLETQDLDLNEIINSMERILRHIAGQGIKVSMCLTEGIDMVTANVSQIEEIVLNLVTNACNAIEDTGQVEISSRVINIEKGDRAQKLEVEPGRYVELVVQDSGKGIDEETLPDIFQPFFTTGDKGYGVGLASISSIVRSVRGGVECKSAIGGGTSFSIYLPVSAR